MLQQHAATDIKIKRSTQGAAGAIAHIRGVLHMLDKYARHQVTVNKSKDNKQHRWLAAWSEVDGNKQE